MDQELRSKQGRCRRQRERKTGHLVAAKMPWGAQDKQQKKCGGNDCVPREKTHVLRICPGSASPQMKGDRGPAIDPGRRDRPSCALASMTTDDSPCYDMPDQCAGKNIR